MSTPTFSDTLHQLQIISPTFSQSRSVFIHLNILGIGTAPPCPGPSGCYVSSQDPGHPAPASRVHPSSCPVRKVGGEPRRSDCRLTQWWRWPERLREQGPRGPAPHTGALTPSLAHLLSRLAIASNTGSLGCIFAAGPSILPYTWRSPGFLEINTASTDAHLCQLFSPLLGVVLEAECAESPPQDWKLSAHWGTWYRHTRTAPFGTVAQRQMARSVGWAQGASPAGAQVSRTQTRPFPYNILFSILHAPLHTLGCTSEVTAIERSPATVPTAQGAWWSWILRLRLVTAQLV